MTFFDSSVLIDQLDGLDPAVEYARRHEDRARTNPLVLYEILEGEVFTRGDSNLQELRDRLRWIDVVPIEADVAMEAARLQHHLREEGTPMAARDMVIAAHASLLGDRVATSDADFDVEGLRSFVDVDLVAPK